MSALETPELFTVLQTRFLRGPNRYASRSILIVWTRFGGLLARLLEAASPDQIGFAGLARAAGGEAIADMVRQKLASLPAGARWIDLTAAMAGEWLDPYSIEPVRGTVTATARQDATVALLVENDQAGVGAWRLACDIVLSIMGTAGTATASMLVERQSQLVRLARDRGLDQLSVAIARTARRLDIPVYPRDGPSRLLQFGQGHLRRMAFETMVEPVGHFGVTEARNKSSTLRVMRRLGLPVLDSGVATNEEGAVSLARQLGGSVVVKPVKGAKGRAVSVDLREADAVRRAYRLAAREDIRVLVERFAAGRDYRLLVVGRKLIAAANRIPASVTGDGRRSIAQLIDALNADPRRGTPYEKLLDRIEPGSASVQDMLSRQAVTLDTVPSDGHQIMLSLTANISQGGTAVDVTAMVHPDNREVAERAAVGLGLGVAGIDFISPDISRSWREVGGWLLEVNTPPGLRPHWIANPEQDVVTPIVRQMFPPGARSRIPTAGVTGSVGKTTTCQMVAHIALAAGRTPGLTTTQGIWSGRYKVASGDSSGGGYARNLLTDPMIDVGVFEFARGGLVKKGMTIDGVDVAAVLNVHDNHVGLDGIATREALAAVKAIIVSAARRWVILNAEDPLVLGMRDLARTARLALVSLDPANPEVVAHREAGGCVITLNGDSDSIRVDHNGGRILDLPLAAIPATCDGAVRSLVSNSLFAAGIAYALGFSPGDIGKGLAGFTSDLSQNPGRHNRIDGLPFELLLTWADGVPALADLMETIDRQSPSGKRRLYLSTPGNRGDDWIRSLGRTAAGHFDLYYCADLSDLRGRKPGETPALVAEGLREAGVAGSAIVQLAGGTQSAAPMLSDAGSGDLLSIVTYETQAALAAIERYRRSLAGGT